MIISGGVNTAENQAELLLKLIENQEAVSAPDLAKRMGKSLRTVERYLDTLGKEKTQMFSYLWIDCRKHFLLLYNKNVNHIVYFLYICSMIHQLEILKGTHPGRIIEYDLKKNGMSQSELAAKAGVSKQRINAIISGRGDLSTELSLKIEEALRYDEGFLMQLQTFFDIDAIKREWSRRKYPNAPRIRRSLFWDYDFDNIDWDRYKKAVIHRILERGSETDWQEIADFYHIPVENLPDYRLPEKYYTPTKR